MTQIPYEDRYYLNKIVGLINPSKSSILSVSMMPNVPELLKAVRNYRELDTYKEAFEEALKLYNLCNKHNVMPFWTLRFDYYTQLPKIEYQGPKCFGSSVHSEPLMTCKLPLQFAKSKMWYGIGMDSYGGEREIKDVKAAVDEFMKKGYVTTSFHLKLFLEDELDIFGSNGKIIVHGKMPVPDLEELVAADWFLRLKL
jgi:hypothetical protein